MVVETRSEQGLFPGFIITKKRANKPGGINSDTKQPLSTNKITVLNDYRDKLGSPIITSSDGSKWRPPNGYVRHGYKASLDRGQWQRSYSDSLTSTQVWSAVDMSAVPVPDLDGYDSNGYGLIDSNLEAYAANEALEKLRDSGVNYALLAAEWHLSVRTLTDRAVPFWRALIAMRKPELGGFNGALRILGLKKKLFANHVSNWSQFVLEYQYGWKPMLSDIHGLYDEVGREFNSNSMIVKGRSSKMEPRSNSFEISYPWVGKGKYEAHTRYTASLFGEVEHSHLRDAMQMGLVNPLEILWERTPYSFVIDWFMPVGQLISNITATAGLNFKSATMTRSSKYKYSVERLPTGTLGWQVISPAVYRRESYFTHRYALSHFPLPLPYVKNPFSTQHMLNASALFYESRRR